MLTLIEGAEVFSPDPLGVRDVLVLGGAIARIGGVDPAAVERLGVPFERIDGRGSLLTPGLVDPHSHLIGTGGEQGYASRHVEVRYEELVEAGVTTVVGCLGTDDVTRHLQPLLGRVRQLQSFGLHALLYTGSFHIPPPTLTGTVRGDFQLIPEVVGVGEFAISDFRSTEPLPIEVARLVSEALVGGLLGEKAGVVHFHVGPGKRRLKILFQVLDAYDVPARHLYPTHLNRGDELLAEGVALAKRGGYVDFDCIESATQWVRKYVDGGAPLEQLTLSSDAHCPGGDERKLRDEVFGLAREGVLPLEKALMLGTTNAARALKLPRKGRIEVGADADLLLVEPRSYRVREVLARGRRLMRGGQVLAPPTSSFEVK